MRSSIQLSLLAFFLVAGQADAQQCVDLQVGDDGTGQSIGIVLSEISPRIFSSSSIFSAQTSVSPATQLNCSPNSVLSMSRWGLLAAVLVAAFAISTWLKGATAAPGV